MSPNGLGEFNGFKETVSIGVVGKVETDGVDDLGHALTMSALWTFARIIFYIAYFFSSGRFSA